MCWYLNGRKCLISYLLILRDHASLWLGNKHETKLEAIYLISLSGLSSFTMIHMPTSHLNKY